MLLLIGLHLGYNGNVNEKQKSNLEQTFKYFLSPGSRLQFDGIEGGIASNRES
jgi:hypothetical protein